jgi:hypothetical protein
MDLDNAVNVTFGELVRLINGETFVTLNHRGVYGLLPVEIKFDFECIDGKIKTNTEEIMNQLVNNRENIEFIYQHQKLDKTRVIIDSGEDYEKEITSRLQQLIKLGKLTNGINFTSIWCYAVPHCRAGSEPQDSTPTAQPVRSVQSTRPERSAPPADDESMPRLESDVTTAAAAAAENDPLVNMYSSLLNLNMQKNLSPKSRPKLVCRDDYAQK